MALNDIKEWQRRLGLFPVPLRKDFDESGPFVLLNGFKGSFCLALEENARASDAVRSIAWSSNVGHYVALGEEAVEVRRWDRPGNVEKYDLQSINEQLEAFHEYLERDSPDPNSSVITHGIRIFRSLRTALGPNISGEKALKVFLFLLASACQGVPRESVDPGDWNLDAEAAQNAFLLSDSDWSSLLQGLKDGRPIERLAVHADLLLRHASGLLFQEAHFEALLSPTRQLNFDFSIPEPAKLSALGIGIGLHFTPPALARTLVEESLAELNLEQISSVSILDPACGSGEFLRESLRQLRLLRYAGQIELRGWDISDAACSMARFSLTWDVDGDRNVAIDIQRRDSLSADHEWPANLDLVLMNPPFVSWENMTDVQRGIVRDALGPQLQKRPDLSAAFLFRASKSLRPGGVLGAVLPASFFGANSTKELRQQLGSSLRAKLIARLGSHTLFQGALVDVGLYVAKAEDSLGNTPLALWSDYKASSISAALRSLRKIRHTISLSSYPIVEVGFSIYPHPGLGSDSSSWAPRPYKPLQLLQQLSPLPRARDLFDIRQGARTGLNKAFVISKEDWEDLPAEEREFFRPAVLNQSLREGALNDSVYIFFPYGSHEIPDEGALRRSLKVYMKRFLSLYRAELKARSSSSDRWWELVRHRNWQIENKQKLVSSYFGDRGSFAWDSSGDFVVVQGFGWLPRRNLPSRAFSRRLALAYLALLNSSLFSQLLSATSNNVAGGQWDLSPRFVGDIPLPALQDPQLIADLAKIGTKIHRGLLAEVPQEEYEETVNAAYLLPGLSSDL
jgi:adenine-specific DNA-methyltransferase